MWFDGHRNRERSVANGGRRLVADIEAFLSGDYAECRQHRGEAVPLVGSALQPVTEAEDRDLRPLQEPGDGLMLRLGKESLCH